MMPALHGYVDGDKEIIACLTNGVAKKNILIPVLHDNHWVLYQILVNDNKATLLIHDSANIHHDNSEFRIKIENLIKEQRKNFSYEKSKVYKIQIDPSDYYCGGYTARAMIGLLKNPEEKNNIWFECGNLDHENLGSSILLEIGKQVGIAELLNNKYIDGETEISIDKLEDYMLTTGKILSIESVSKTDNPAQNAALLILRLLSSRLQTFKFEEPAVQNVLDTLIENEVISEQDKIDISNLSPKEMLSRAEILFGKNTSITHIDIGNAFRR
jgi:hypothetical protein